MKATRTFLVVITAAAVAGACSQASSPVAPPETGLRNNVGQATSSTDTVVVAEQRGVHTFGSGN
jgi:hypothetical protein